jgi:hypothetical protein
MFIPLHAHILFLLKFIVLNEIACFSNILVKYSIQHFFFISVQLFLSLQTQSLKSKIERIYM